MLRNARDSGKRRANLLCITNWHGLLSKHATGKNQEIPVSGTLDQKTDLDSFLEGQDTLMPQGCLEGQWWKCVHQGLRHNIEFAHQPAQDSLGATWRCNIEASNAAPCCPSCDASQLASADPSPKMCWPAIAGVKGTAISIRVVVFDHD